MRDLVLALATFVLAWFGAEPAGARALTASERTELVRTVDRFDAAMRASRIEEIIGIVPPRVIAHLAKQGGIEVEALRAVMVRQTSEVMKAAVIRSFEMKLANAKHRNLADGAPYVLIPTELSMEIGGRKIQTNSGTLAMMDGGAWYLLDLDQTSRVVMFTQVYPEYANAEFGGKTMKAAP